VKVTRQKLLLGGVAGAAVLFALQGGQYSTLDLLRFGSEEKRLKAEIELLKAEVDSLAAYKRALATDAKLQERIAREMWGMVKDGEIVYKLVR
jgi:cell division protein FtsB